MVNTKSRLRSRIKQLSMTIIFLLVSQAHGLEKQINPALAKLFDDAGVTGTFVLYDVSAKRLVVHNQQRAETRFIPASTFKIPNSLIGLSVGAVKNVEEVLPYGGKPQPFKVWEQDMALRDAIKVSNVPVFQELARRIGLVRMQENVTRINYGNKEIGNQVDKFWLLGPLKISPLEQTQFLARLALGELSFSSEVQQSVREISQLEHGEDWVLYGKTGWANTETTDIGWWVGWVVKQDRVFSFALNIDMPNKADVAKRVDLGKACLKVLNIF